MSDQRTKTMETGRMTVTGNHVQFDTRTDVAWRTGDTWELTGRQRSLLAIFLTKFGREIRVKGKDARQWRGPFSEGIMRIVVAKLETDPNGFYRLTELSKTPEALAANVAVA